jgi:PAS domain S-box-containing protein/putative nucleotidyltransferase with HDIG domain
MTKDCPIVLLQSGLEKVCGGEAAEQGRVLSRACPQWRAARSAEELGNLYSTVLENTGTAIIIIEEDFTITYANIEFEQLSGFEKQEIIEKKLFTEFIPASDLDRIKEYHRLRRADKKDAPRNYEFSFIDRAGHAKNIYITVSLIPKTTRAIASLIDISGLKRVEKNLSWEVKVNAALAELSGELIAAISLEEISCQVLERAKLLTDSHFGYVGSIDPLTGCLITHTMTRDIWDACAVENKGIVFRKIGGLPGWVLENKKPLLTNSPHGDPRAAGTPPGHIPINRFLAVPVLLDGKLAGQIALANSDRDYTLQDLTLAERLAALYSIAIQRIRTDQALQKSEKRYRMLFNSGNDAIFVHGLNRDKSMGKFIEVNNVACQRLGYSKEEFLQLSPRDINYPVSKDDTPVINRLLEEKHLLFERVHLAKDGARIPVEINAHLLELDGRLAVLSVARDVTERKRAEEALKKAKEDLTLKVEERTSALRAINEQLRHELKVRRRVEGALRESQAGLAHAQRIARLGNWDWNVVKNELRWSEEIYRIFGVEQREYCLTFEDFLDSVHPGDREMVLRAVREALYNRKPYSIDHRIVLPDGSGRIVHEEAETICNELGEAVRMFGTVQDITLRKQAEEELKRGNEALKNTLDGTVKALATMAEKRDPYTAGHQQRVAQLASAIAGEMGKSAEEIEAIHVAGLLHDIGKIYVPTDILSKPGCLTDLELSLTRTHVQAGHDILKTIPFTWPIAQIMLQHHERMDGSGYPAGLEGKNIILEARILGVADVVEAMSSHRPYRPSLGIEKALEEIQGNRNRLYDPEVVKACLDLFKGNRFRFL